jgi:hypothetical protein
VAVALGERVVMVVAQAGPGEMAAARGARVVQAAGEGQVGLGDTCRLWCCRRRLVGA